MANDSMSTITIIDESLTGDVVHKSTIEVNSESLTVKDIIESRVISEVDNYNTGVEEKYYGLVQPTALEKKLNQDSPKKKVKIDAEKQVYVALEAFLKNGFFVLIDDVQAESLDQEVFICNDTRISFVKLTPLVGG